MCDMMYVMCLRGEKRRDIVTRRYFRTRSIMRFFQRKRIEKISVYSIVLMPWFTFNSYFGAVILPPV